MPITRKQEKYLYANDMGKVAKKLKKHNKKKSKPKSTRNDARRV